MSTEEKKQSSTQIHKANAFDKAAAYLSAQPRTQWEVRKYLKQKEYDPSEIDDAVEQLLEYGYLDDLEYCRSYIRVAAEKGKGQKKIRQELEARGIGRETMEEAFPELDEKKRALEVAVKMARQQLSEGKGLDEKFLARAARRLAGLGYTTDVIYFVIGKLRGIKTR
ncbi:MAG: regulatory protein RecX [Anaerovoracaceae bacterium]